jgi:hypothetical protein
MYRRSPNVLDRRDDVRVNLSCHSNDSCRLFAGEDRVADGHGAIVVSARNRRNAVIGKSQPLRNRLRRPT